MKGPDIENGTKKELSLNATNQKITRHYSILIRGRVAMTLTGSPL